MTGETTDLLFNRLTTRRSSGGQNWQAVEVKQGPAWHLRAATVILLIHGFNVDEPAAHRAYEKFARSVSWDQESLSQQFRNVWEFHWPGDLAGNHPIRGKTSYPARPGVAFGVGRELAEFLNSNRDIRQARSIVIVGHSLGCRVALACLARILEMSTSYTGPTVTELLLMAPAVPEELCQPGGDFAEVPPHARGTVLYSRRDEAFRFFVFWKGQRGWGEPGRAVGRYGGPRGRWEDSVQTRYHHGDYWGSEIVAAMFRTPAGRYRLVPEYDIGEQDIEERDLHSNDRSHEVRPLGSRV
jgi:pimeloyl-ACP methyl ester carboxylesterase